VNLQIFVHRDLDLSRCPRDVEDWINLAPLPSGIDRGHNNYKGERRQGNAH
jgi:hypothetical protein